MGPRLARETGLKPPKAAAWLDIILAHFSDFHCRTIDSLVYALLRAFSLEMGLKPELEVVFEEDAVLDLCFDRLLARVGWREAEDRLCRLFTDLLETYLRIEEAGGLVVERGIRRRIRELYKKADIPCLAGPCTRSGEGRGGATQRGRGAPGGDTPGRGGGWAQ